MQFSQEKICKCSNFTQTTLHPSSRHNLFFIFTNDVLVWSFSLDFPLMSFGIDISWQLFNISLKTLPCKCSITILHTYTLFYFVPNRVSVDYHQYAASTLIKSLNEVAIVSLSRHGFIVKILYFSYRKMFSYGAVC